MGGVGHVSSARFIGELWWMVLSVGEVWLFVGAVVEICERQSMRRIIIV